MKQLSLPVRFSIALVVFYQKTFSRDHGKDFCDRVHCRFEPTCSSYAIGALTKYGFFIGWLKSLWRILRCNPWGKGGVDMP